MVERIERYGEHVQTQRQRENEFARKVRVRKGIEIGNEAIADREWYQACCIARDKLAPELLRGGTIREFDREIDSDDWHPAELNRFISKSKQYALTLAKGNDCPAAQELSWKQNGYRTPHEAARETTKAAFDSLEALAIHLDLVRDEMRNFVEARGFSTRMGRMWKSPRMHLSDPLYITSRDSGLMKTLFHGGTGQGKSTSLGTGVEDRYNINNPNTTVPSKIEGHKYGGECKILDILDFREGENMVYDIPQQDEDLKRVREDHGLPPTFEDTDKLLDPSIEILVPLTPGLNDHELPWNTLEDEWAIEPFTIPASSLSKQLLVSLMASMVTPQQETTLRTAYDAVDKRESDWALKDLAEEVMERDDLGESYQKRVTKLLTNIQNMGFIRTNDCPHAISDERWTEIFESTDTITSFSMAFMEDMIGKLMVTGYVVDTLEDLRSDMDIPDAALVMRELHKAAPHRGETSFDNQEESLQDVIAQKLSLIVRENRHVYLEVLADTQDITHLKKGPRKQFNRFVTFNTSRESLEKLFDYSASSNYKSCYRSLTAEKGEGAVVGQADPLVKRTDLDYLAHVQFVPPSWHHLDTDIDNNGWEARAEYLEHEELRPADFEGAEVPDELTIDERVTEKNEKTLTSMEKFIDECTIVTKNRSDWEATEDVRNAYNKWAADTDEEMIESTVSFGREWMKHTPDEVDKSRREQQQAYLGVKFNALGKDYARK